MITQSCPSLTWRRTQESLWSLINTTTRQRGLISRSSLVFLSIRLLWQCQWLAKSIFRKLSMNKKLTEESLVCNQMAQALQDQHENKVLTRKKQEKKRTKSLQQKRMPSLCQRTKSEWKRTMRNTMRLFKHAKMIQFLQRKGHKIATVLKRLAVK